MNIARDIKTVLEHLAALGFESLPVTIRRAAGGEGRHKRERAAPHHFPDLRASEIKKAAIDALRQEIGDCKRCGLSTGRKNLVFGEGNLDADIMFIGEAPGRDEDLQGRPFVGDAGKLLTRLIEKMGFRREEVYIGNIIKCRPPMNRDPEEDEIKTCIQFIEKQIAIIAPKVIVPLGRISAHSLLNTKTPITRLRGTFYEYKGIPVMPTFHPAYLLRNPKDKWLVWEDAQKVLDLLRKEKR